MSWDNVADAFKRLSSAPHPQWEGYLGFYSSWLGGYFREPWAMMVPMDDHGFHRGDGVFEAGRIVDGAYYDLQEHLLRLKNSAAAVGMELPKSTDEMAKICVELARRCQSREAVLRIYVTRGPGDFSPNPRAVVGHQIYVVLTRWNPPREELYQKGASTMISTVSAKAPFWSKIKSLNYLQNVLMKKECVEKGVDFSISVDPSGRLCEGATENMMMISKQNELLVPKFDYTLRGTTVRRAMKLAEQITEIKAIRHSDLFLDDLLEAKEAAFVGTTLGVLPMSRVGDHTLPVGPLCRKLNALLQADMKESRELRTTF